MKSLAVATITLALVSCAATPMSQEQSQSRLIAQKQEIGLDHRCCMEIRDMHPISLVDGPIDQAFDATSHVISLNGQPTTANIYQIKPGDTNKQIEFFSYSDKKRSVFRFDSAMFIAPAFLFLDSDFQPTQSIDLPAVCWGAKIGHGGLWARTDIPTNAAYVVVAARNDKNLYAIDTRQTGSAAPAIEALGDARQSYATTVGTGYGGIYSVGLVDSSSTRLGRCFLPPQ